MKGDRSDLKRQFLLGLRAELGSLPLQNEGAIALVLDLRGDFDYQRAGYAVDSWGNPRMKSETRYELEDEVSGEALQEVAAAIDKLLAAEDG